MIEKLIDRITRASLRFKWTTIGLTVLVMVAGTIAMFQLKQELMPKIEFPQSVILALNPGSEAEEMLDEVTIPIENAVNTIDGIVNVESTTSRGLSVLVIRNEFGMDQDAMQDELQAAVESVTYPDGMETPELLTFSLSDLPLAAVSVSSSELSFEELKEIVETEILPSLEEIDGVARVDIGGGQELPEEVEAVAEVVSTPEPTVEPTATSEPTATPTTEPTATPEPTAVPTETPAAPEGPTPVDLPTSWIEAAAAQGMEIATTADMTPEIVGGIASFAPEMLQELTPEMLLAIPLDALAALPQEYLAELDPELQGQLAERAAAAQVEPTEEPPVVVVDGVPLPDTWIQGARAQGLEIATTADLTPELVAGIAGFAPQFLAELTPEMLLSMSPEALTALPEDFLLTLDEDLQTQLGELIAQAPQPEEPEDPAALPASWQAAAQAQDIDMTYATDVTPEMMQALSSLAPQMLNDLTPDNLRLFSPEVLSWLPPDFVDTLDAELKAELEALAAPVGGLSAAFIVAEEEAAALSADAPALSELWTNPPEESSGPSPTFETAADIINSGFADSGAEFLNMFVASGRVTAPAMIGDLTPEIVAWLNANEEGFLTNLDAGVLRLFAPETLSSLPEEFMVSLDAELRDELEGIAAGTVTVFVPDNTITRVDGKPGLTITVFKDGEANTVDVSHAVFEKLDELEAADGLSFAVAFEQASFIEESVSSVARESALGAFFAVVVILFFLSGRNGEGKFVLSWRSTLVIGVSIPLSVTAAFVMLQWVPIIVSPILASIASATASIPILGFLMNLISHLFPSETTLNLMTLSGMTVAIGRVVDDSIVVLENIYRHIQRGDNHKDSVLQGTKDVAIAILVSTITTVIVFLPIGMIGGIVGEFFLPFGIAVTYALLASFVVAITIVPVLAFLFIKKEHLPPEGKTEMQRRYQPLLRWSLNHRAVVLVVAGLIFAGSLFLMGQLPRAFMPEMGDPQITVTIELPTDFSMGETDEIVRTFEDAIADIDGLGVVVTEIGTTGGLEERLMGGGSVTQTKANVVIGIETADELDALTAVVRAEANDIFGNEQVIVTGGTLATSAFGSFALVLSGDSETLATVNDEVIVELGKIEGLTNVTSNLGEEGTFLRVDGESAALFTGDLESENSLGVIATAKGTIEEVVPASITVSEGFESEQQTEGFAQASQAILISIVVVYVVLLIAFNSFVHPFTILLSLPLAVVGAALALWFTQRPLGMSAMIGLMMLVGIVVTNAVVLIERVQTNRKERGMNVYDALMEGGTTRLRPILMTAIAAMMALAPLAIGLSEGAIIASELGMVVIGGLFTSTLLTLFVVPVMFSLLNRLTRTGRAEAKQASGN